jgi:hypothetical protein
MREFARCAGRSKSKRHLEKHRLNLVPLVQARDPPLENLGDSDALVDG